MNGLVPLIADIGDIIGVLVFIVIGLLSVAGQIMNKAKEKQQRAAPPRPRPRPPQPQPRQQQGPLANEVDQFVRQAAQRRGEGGRQPVAQGQGRPQLAQRRPLAQQQPVEAVPVELLEPMSDDTGSVAEHVRTHVSSRHVGTVGSRTLQSQVDQADENMEEHVHEVFDHKLGRLSSTPGETADQPGPTIPPTAAAGMAAMLSDASSIRQAIVLSEILQRPEHNWS